MPASSSACIRVAADLTTSHIFSMGFKSGEFGGFQASIAPRRSQIALRSVWWLMLRHVVEHDNRSGPRVGVKHGRQTACKPGEDIVDMELPLDKIE